MLTLATYNLYKGGPEDFSAWARTLGALAPDILLLQESCAPDRYLGTLPPERHAQVQRAPWAPAAANAWGSAISLAQGTATMLPLPAALHGWVVGADIHGLRWRPGANGPLRVFSLHTPTSAPCAYERDLNTALSAIAPLAVGHDVILGGDFNVTISVRHSAEERTNTPGEIAIHQRLRNELGLINCWQALHPDEALAQTLRYRFSDAPQSFHLDGLFVPAAWRPFLRTCAVHNDADWRRKGSSDHFPVVATFTP